MSEETVTIGEAPKGEATPALPIDPTAIAKPIDIRKRAFIYDTAKLVDRARAEGKKGIVIGFQDGARHVVLRNGTHVRTEKKNRNASGKAVRKMKIAQRREAREAAAEAQIAKTG